jgi:hypothetical protein
LNRPEQVTSRLPGHYRLPADQAAAGAL